MAEAEGPDDLAEGGHGACGADDRRDRCEDVARALRVESDGAAGLHVQEIGGRWRIDHDVYSETNKHQRLGVEARRVDRGLRHRREQVENRGIARSVGHVVPFLVRVEVPRRNAIGRGPDERITGEGEA